MGFFSPFSYPIANLSVACVSAASSTFHSDGSFSSLHSLMAKTALVTGISVTFLLSRIIISICSHPGPGGKGFLTSRLDGSILPVPLLRANTFSAGVNAN